MKREGERGVLQQRNPTNRGRFDCCLALAIGFSTRDVLTVGSRGEREEDRI